MEILNFHDAKVTTFWHPSGACICQMPGHRLSRPANTFRVSAFHQYHWFGVKLFPVGYAQDSRRYPKNVKNAVFGSGSCPHYKIPEFFMIAPVLTSTLTVCRRNRGNPSCLYRT